MSTRPNSDRSIEAFLTGAVVTVLLVAAGGNWLVGNLASLFARRQLLDADMGRPS